MADSWSLEFLQKSALPFALLLALLIVAAAVFFSARRADEKPRPVMRRLMLPVAAIMLFLMLGSAALMKIQQRNQLDETSQWLLKSASRELSHALAEQSRAIAALMEVLVKDEGLRAGLKAMDRQQLLDSYASTFAKLNNDLAITHFYFMDPERGCLLRVHKPEKFGDRFDRHTALEAERTGKTASGIEIGPLGTFTLRVVRPVFDAGTLIGYLELGKEIEDALDGVHKNTGAELAVALRKHVLDRGAWEVGMKMLGREAAWDRFAENVLIYSTLAPFPVEAEPHVGGPGLAYTETPSEARFHGLAWRLMRAPLRDVSGAEVGHLIVMHEVSTTMAAHHRRMMVAAAAGVVFLFALFVFLFIMLRRTDAGIHAQQEELRKSEEKHRLLTEHAVSAVATHEIVFDDAGIPVDYIFLSVNQSFETHTGLRAADVVGRRVTEVFPGIRKTSFIEVYGKVALTGEPVSFEQYFEPLGRHYFINAYRLGKGRFATVFSDITERQRAEAALRESETRFRALTDSAQDAIIIIDPEGRISYWNLAAEKILGYPTEEALGENLHNLLAPERYRKAHEAAFPGFVRTGCGNAVGQTVELEARRKDGREISVALSLSAVSLQGKWHAIGILRDISDRKRAETELIESNRQLVQAIDRANELALAAEQANTIKGEFLANMSHEIRTPMNAVIGMTGLLLDTPLTGEQREYTEIVRSSGEALLNLINDILDFSKIEAGKLELEVLDFDLRLAVEDTAAMLAAKAHEKALELTCLVEPEVPAKLKGDPGRLRQVITNLAGNAVKFTPAGEVAIRVRLESESERAAVLRFSITDTGIGIPAGRIESLFQPFVQLDGSTTRKYGGTGLGLSISKQLIELMGGRLDVESKEGKGSTFWFTAVFEKSAGESPRKEVWSTDTNGVRVLVVDDHSANRLLIARLLDAWGFRHAEACNGSGALSALREAAASGDVFQVALIDLQMPDMDGEMLGRCIKEDERLKATRLVMLTSLGRRGDAKRLEKAGFCAYLTKPIRQDQLRDCLNLALSANAGRDDGVPPSIITRHTISEARKRAIRILIAEDNITNQQVARAILDKLGYKADAVANGQEAIEALKAVPYDLVFMDCQMPEMDGYEATRILRQTASSLRNPAIPIIAMTAHAMKGDREKCLEAGMNDYLPKPISPDALSEKLERWLGDRMEKAVEAESVTSRLNRERKASAATDSFEPATAGSDHLPVVFDRGSFLERMLGDEELAESVLKEFLGDIPRQIAELRAYIQRPAADHAAGQAHKIKGAAANVGGMVLSAVALEMERAGKDHDWVHLQQLLPRLESEFERLRAVMQGE